MMRSASLRLQMHRRSLQSAHRRPEIQQTGFGRVRDNAQRAFDLEGFAFGKAAGYLVVQQNKIRLDFLGQCQGLPLAKIQMVKTQRNQCR